MAFKLLYFLALFLAIDKATFKERWNREDI